MSWDAGRRGVTCSCAHGPVARSRAVATLAALICAATMATACNAPRMPGSSGHPLDGGEAPRFSVQSQAARDVGVPGSPTTRVTVLDFWASWCVPCVRSLPGMERLYRSHHAEGLQVIGVNIDEEASVAEQAAADAGTTFPVVHDPQGRVARSYGIRSIPMTFVIDGQGIVRWSGRDPEAMRVAVETLLLEAAGGAQARLR